MLGLFVFDNVSDHSEAVVVQAHHGTGLVLLSLLVAFVSCCAAFYMAHINQQSTTLNHRRISLLCASMVLGLGIWAMHFIGMLAMHLPVRMHYNALITAASILPGIGAAWLALWFLLTQHPSIQRVLLSGILVGAGIAVMHYSGLYAIELDGRIVFDFSLFLQSLLLGMVFSIAAFAMHRWIYLHHRFRQSKLWLVIPPLLMTVAMASMHYVSMHALRLVMHAQTPEIWLSAAGIENNNTLSFIVALIAVVVFVIFGLTNALFLYRDLWRAVAVRDARLNAMLETAPEGVITITDRGIVQEFNVVAQRIFGYAKEEVIGRNISILMPSPLAEQHDGHLHKHIEKPDRPLQSRSREVLGKHKDGRHISLELTIGKTVSASGTIFVGYLQDISERKRTDAQLRIAASVFQHVREGVAIVDAHHNISDVNPTFLRLMEKERDECIGRPLEELYEHADTPPDMRKLWQTVAMHQYWQNEIMLTRHNGSIWMQRLSISPVLNELKRPHHFIAVISDVSERPGLEAILSHADLHDSATGLPSHKLFLDRLSNSLLTAKRKLHHVGVIIIQVEPPASPAMQPSSTDSVAVLRILAELLQQQLRSTDTLARYGEHQLALLLPGVKDAETFRTLVHRLGKPICPSNLSYAKFRIEELQLGYTSTLQCQGTASELLELAMDDLMPWHTHKPLLH